MGSSFYTNILITRIHKRVQILKQNTAVYNKNPSSTPRSKEEVSIRSLPLSKEIKHGNGTPTIKHRATETRIHQVSSYKDQEVWVHVLPGKGLAIMNNNPYPLQQTRSKSPEKTINWRSNSFIGMKTVFSKHKNLKRKQIVFILVASFDGHDDCNKNRLHMENNQPQTQFGALI